MKRPACVTILLWSVLSLAAWSGVRLVTTILWWSSLTQLTSQFICIYLFSSALVWAVISLILLRSFWKSTRFGHAGFIVASIGFLLWYWLDRIILPPLNLDWGFAAGLSTIASLCTILCSLNPGSQRYFSQRENYEKQSENPKT
jgi:hypothetical protein